MAWTTPRTWVAGEVVTAALLNTHLRDNLNAISGIWTAYTPTIVNGTGNGTETRTGAYTQIGKTVAFQAKLVWGTSFTISAGVGLSLPVTAASGATGVLSVIYTDVGSNTYTAAGVLQASAVATGVIGTNGAGVTTTFTVPFTWVTGDIIEIAGVYQAA